MKKATKAPGSSAVKPAHPGEGKTSKKKMFDDDEDFDDDEIAGDIEEDDEADDLTDDYEETEEEEEEIEEPDISKIKIEDEIDLSNFDLDEDEEDLYREDF